MLENRAVVQSDLDRLTRDSRSSEIKYKDLNLGWNNSMNQYYLVAKCPRGSSADKQAWC